MFDLRRHRQTYLRLCFFACLAFLVGGCGENDTGDLVRRSLESIREDQGIVGRSAITCKTGDCIILHLPPGTNLSADESEAREKSAMLEKFLEVVMQHNDDDKSNDGYIVPVGERWGGQHPTLNTLSTFNCCTYVMGDVLNLDSADWLDTHRRHPNEPQAPVQIVLDSYFRKILVSSTRELDWEELIKSTTLKEDDLICFSINLGKKYRLVHIGFAKKNGPDFWMECKLGPGPIVRATLSAMAKGYAGQFDQVIIFRRAS